MEHTILKRGWNIYLYYWTIPVFFLFFLINYFTRNFIIENLNLNLMISVVTFLFGFLISINFSILLSRYSELKDCLASETGRLVTLYNLSKRLGDKFHKLIREKIDKYTLVTLRDYTNYQAGREIVYSMYDDLKEIKLKKPIDKFSASSFLSNLSDLEEIREKLEYLTAKRAEWSLKYSMYVLGIIFIILLFLNRGGSFSNSLFVILSTTVIFIFLIIEDYDNLNIGDYNVNISNSEQIFDLIGKDRYYPEDIIKRVNLEKGKIYRIGIIDEKTGKETIYYKRYKPFEQF